MRNPKSRRVRIRSDSPKKKKQKIEISSSDSSENLFQLKNFTAVFEASFQSLSLDCTICGYSMDSTCGLHLKNPEAENKKCEICIGKCNHGYHFCCLAKYLAYAGEKTLDECLQCESKWEFKEKLPI
ncbi:Oidioi.mRNA.OKI2018_I69.chr1.g3825.t1.cds [Oikopleura dioica]|uniref:Oidioi.mRNA.OKI2018_I69.chr1.g3825.t1.cds n=1 Tax=Oikopleura dioica TaxID=34765 RepID=A0ABN7T4I1_OIKDI|nr:Oidioi.mRNA.OKI2018_I69.chr1.g3825.t1.cds [Oikopleura dioica]